ncbi:sugar phosphate isomerase/epimerase [bacterium]|nr:sugar phosphate isomerase/epimerase [bacterium]MBU1919533.1 sugar phosphate isomerase/epimerase [bacterium]
MFGDRHVYCSVDQIADAIPHLKELELGIEIVFDSTETLWPQVRWEDLLEKADSIRKANLKATVHGPFHGINLGSRDSHIREFSEAALIAGIETCVSFHSPLMVLHTGFIPQLAPKSRRKWLDSFISGLERVVEEASKHKVLLALENTYEEDTELFAEVFESIPHPHLRMCLDTGHATCFGKVEPLQWVERFADRISHLHLSDNDGAADLHQSLGAGCVEFQRLLKPLSDSANTITLTYEVAGSDVPESEIYFRSIMKELKQ